jgi:hypothetical protein
MIGPVLACIVLAPHWTRLVRGWQAHQQFPENISLAHWPCYLSLMLGTFVVVLAHGAIASPGDPAPWLQRSALAMAAVTWTSFACGLLLPRLMGPASVWSQVGRRLATPLGITACVLLLLLLIQEFVFYDARADVRTTPLAGYAVGLVAVAVGLLLIGALTFAVSPRRDLLQLSERGRTLYVYAVEILICLLLVHLRLNIPDINLGAYSRYWPFIIMGVAFAGVGLSELAQRRGLRVLADPLQRTALFLPLLPILAFLVKPLGHIRVQAENAVGGIQPFVRYLERMPDDYRWHASLWFMMGLLYMTVALTRRSSNIVLVAVLVANFGLWVIFGHHDGLGFLLHPQLWLIPIGLIVLAAEHFNQERLQPAQSVILRYSGLLVIYASSSADMYIAGLGNNVFLPIVLALLSVGGVLLGILLRVRAFLFLGTAFLFLVVFSQIWHAAVDRAHTWVWWASGIVLGAAILTLFALFEKRRNDVLKVIDQIKRWK